MKPTTVSIANKKQGAHFASPTEAEPTRGMKSHIFQRPSKFYLLSPEKVFIVPDSCYRLQRFENFDLCGKSQHKESSSRSLSRRLFWLALLCFQLRLLLVSSIMRFGCGVDHLVDTLSCFGKPWKDGNENGFRIYENRLWSSRRQKQKGNCGWDLKQWLIFWNYL